MADAALPAPTADEALHTTVDLPFEDAVPFVQLARELADFETVRVTRLDPTLAGMLPCTTAAYERAGDDRVHVRHVSATKAIRDLGCASAAGVDGDAVEALVAKTGELMATVRENVETHGRE